MFYKLRQLVKKNKLISKIYYNLDSIGNKHKYEKKVKNFRIYGETTAKKLVEVLEKTDFSYFMTFGTMLGIVRDNKFLPFDDDLDIAIEENELFSWEKLENVLKENGFKVKHRFSYKTKITEETFVDINNVSIDFFLHEQNEDGFRYSYFYERKEGKIYPSPNMFSVQKMCMPKLDKVIMQKVNGIDYPVPSNFDDFLKHFYGPSWKIPDPSWVDNGYNYKDCDGYGYLIKGV